MIYENEATLEDLPGGDREKLLAELLLLEEDDCKVPCVEKDSHYRMVMEKVNKVIDSDDDEDEESNSSRTSSQKSIAPSSSSLKRISSADSDELDLTKKQRSAAYARKMRLRRKAELVYLRDRVSGLEAKLKVMRYTRTKAYNSLRKEVEKRQEAEIENEKLRRLLHDQMILAHKLQEYYVSTSLQDLLTQQTSRREYFSLPSSPDERVSKCSAVLDADIYALYSLFSSKTEFTTVRPLPYISCRSTYDSDTVEIEVCRLAQVPNYSADQVAEGLWDLIHNQFAQLFFGDNTATSAVLQRIDERTLYSRYQCRMGFRADVEVPQLESYSACRRLDHGDNQIFVWRCFLDDEMYPTSIGSARHDENGIIAMQTETAPDGTIRTGIKMLGYFRPPVHFMELPTGLFTESMLGAARDYTSVAYDLLIQCIATRFNVVQN